jgi:hypothetical protein
MLIAGCVAGGVGVILAWLLTKVGDLLFRKSAHPVSIGIFLVLAGAAIGTVYVTYEALANPAGWSAASASGLIRRIISAIGL